MTATSVCDVRCTSCSCRVDGSAEEAPPEGAPPKVPCKECAKKRVARQVRALLLLGPVVAVDAPSAPPLPMPTRDATAPSSVSSTALGGVLPAALAPVMSHLLVGEGVDSELGGSEEEGLGAITLAGAGLVGFHGSPV